MVFILLNTSHHTNSTCPPLGLRRGKWGLLGDVIADRAGVVRRMMCVLIVLLAIGSTTITAQDDTEEIPADAFMQADETRVVTLDGENPTLLIYEAIAPGDVITVSGRSLEADAEPPAVRDVILAVLDADGEQLAYNDNHNSDRDDLAPADALIERLLLPEAGTYTIRVDTYGGIFAGEVEVTLTAADLYDATFDEDADGNLTITATLPRDSRYTYTFEAAAGDILTVTVQDTGLTLDPRLMLIDADGTVVASNDDHTSGDLTLDLLDAQITDFSVEVTGRYTVIITDFLGRAGAFDLTLARR